MNPEQFEKDIHKYVQKSHTDYIDERFNGEFKASVQKKDLIKFKKIFQDKILLKKSVQLSELYREINILLNKELKRIEKKIK